MSSMLYPPKPFSRWTWVNQVAAWRSGNIVGRINEVTLRRAPLVLEWVTFFGRQTTSVFYQVTHANSASYPQRDGKWVPAKVRWCSAAGSKGRYGYSTCKKA